MPTPFLRLPFSFSRPSVSRASALTAFSAAIVMTLTGLTALSASKPNSVLAADAPQVTPATVYAGTVAETLEHAQGEGLSIAYVLMRSEAAPKYVVILFPGGNGVVNARINQNGKLVYGKKNNFLSRARTYLVDDEFATVLTDTSDDLQRFRVLAADLKARFPGAALYLIGTSRGTGATMTLAPRIDDLVAGIAHTSSLKDIRHFDPSGLKAKQLIVHHEDDGCARTPYHAAKRSAERFGTPFVTVTGGISEGDPCQAMAYHGYNGREDYVVGILKDWMKK